MHTRLLIQYLFRQRETVDVAKILQPKSKMIQYTFFYQFKFTNYTALIIKLILNYK